MSYGSQVDEINQIKKKVEEAFDTGSNAHKVKIVEGNVTLNAGDIEIGAVELKDANTDQRAVVNASGELQVADSRIGSLLKLFNESFSFSYNDDGTVSQITINTKDSDGNDKTVTFSFSYDANGNVVSISKEVS